VQSVPNPATCRAASVPVEGLRRIFDRLVCYHDSGVTPRRNTCLQQQHVRAQVSHRLKRSCRVSQVIENTVCIDYIMWFKLSGGRLVSIEQNYFETRKSLAESAHALRSTIRARHDATSIDEEIGVIADPGSDLEDTSTGEVQTKGCEMFLAPSIVTL